MGLKKKLDYLRKSLTFLNTCAMVASGGIMEDAKLYVGLAIGLIVGTLFSSYMTYSACTTTNAFELFHEHFICEPNK